MTNQDKDDNTLLWLEAMNLRESENETERFLDIKNTNLKNGLVNKQVCILSFLYQ